LASSRDLSLAESTTEEVMIGLVHTSVYVSA